MDRAKQSNLSTVIADTFNSNRHVVFISALEMREFKECVMLRGAKYVYISLTHLKDHDNPLYHIASEITNAVDSSNYADEIREIRYSLYKADVPTSFQARDFLHLALRVLDIQGLYVVHLHPYNNVLENKELIEFLEALVQNDQYPNLRFAILYNSSNKKEIKGNTLFSIKNLEISTMKEVFISYSWKEPSNHIVVNDIVPALTKHGVNFVLDKNDCNYMTNIPEFEERIGHGELIIAVISNPYLTSIQCMYEMACIFEAGNVRERLKLVSLDDFDRYDKNLFNSIVIKWETDLKKAEANSNKEFANNPFINDKKYISLILKHIGNFWSFLSSSNTVTLTELGRNGFAILISSLGYTPIEPIINKQIDPINTGTTMNNITIVQNGANSQINVNSGIGTMAISNDYSAKTVLSEESLYLIIEHYLIDSKLVIKREDIEGISALDYLYGQAMDICNTFKHLVEANQLSNILYRNSRTPDETDWQILLYSIAKTYQSASNGNYHISREDNPGNGEIDLHFTKGTEANICLEMKRSSNVQLLHGYNEQLKGYMVADGANRGIFMIIVEDNKNKQQIDEVLDIHKKSKDEGKYTPEIIIVNGYKQVSASNPTYKAPLMIEHDNNNKE